MSAPALHLVANKDTNILKFPETSRCVSCGIPFRRQRAETWKELCTKCWIWTRIERRNNQMRNLLRSIP